VHQFGVPNIKLFISSPNDLCGILTWCSRIRKVEGSLTTKKDNERLWLARELYRAFYDPPSFDQDDETQEVKMDLVLEVARKVRLQDNFLSYHTHIEIDEDGRERLFCYDYGYMEDQNGELVIIRDEAFFE